MEVVLEQILNTLLVADNVVIKQATKELKEAFKSPEIVATLCKVVCCSQTPQIRQYAAILLRQKFKRRRQWKSYSDDLRNNIKQMIIQRLQIENEKLPKLAIADLGAMVAKYEIPQNSWPEFWMFILNNMSSEDPQVVELGLLVLKTLIESLGEEIKPHVALLLKSFPNLMEKYRSNKNIIYYSIKILILLTPSVGSDEKMLFENLIPGVVVLIKAFIQEDEERACEMMELFDELLETEVNIVVPFINSIINWCLELVSDSSTPDDVKVRALNLISSHALLRPKALVQRKIIVPILKTLFLTMSLPVEEDAHEMFAEDGDLTNSPVVAAAQAMDTMALNLPPEKIVDPLLEMIEQAFQSSNPYHQKAAFTAIAVISEGCAEYLREKYFVPLLESVCKGIKNENPIISRAALYSLGQFSQNFSTDIAKYTEEFIHPFLNYLSLACQNMKENKQTDLTRLFYAFEQFVENLDEHLIPYLPTVMEQLFTLLQYTTDNATKEMVFGAFGSIAHSAKDKIIPYTDALLNLFKDYIIEEQPHENSSLQVQALSTLGILARAAGESHFLPMSKDCVRLGLKLLENASDPDLKRSVFRMFGSMSVILKDDMAEFLPLIIPYAFQSFRSNEGYMTTSQDAEAMGPLSFFDIDETEEVDLGDEDDESDEDDDDDVVVNILTSSYADEKVDACDMLKELAENSVEPMLPYIGTCLNEVLLLMRHSESSIHQIVFESLGVFCCIVHIRRKKDDPAIQAALIQLEDMLPLFSETIESSPNRDSVIAALGGLEYLLKQTPENCPWKDDWLKQVSLLAFKVMEKKVACQGTSDEAQDDDDDDESQAEQDIKLFEHAAELIPNLCKFMSPEDFDECFVKFTHIIGPKIVSKCSAAERSFAVGMLAYCCENMKGRVKNHIGKFLLILTAVLNDDDPEVLSNAVYAVGLLAEYSEELLYPDYKELLQYLSKLITLGKPPRVIDNVCGAVARLILTNPSGVPLDMVFPVLIQQLPIKEDFEEIKTIFRCFLFLLKNNHPQVLQHIETIFNIGMHTLKEKKCPSDGEIMILQVVDYIEKQHPETHAKLIASISTNLAEDLDQAMNRLIRNPESDMS